MGAVADEEGLADGLLDALAGHGLVPLPLQGVASCTELRAHLHLPTSGCGCMGRSMDGFERCGVGWGNGLWV